VRLGLLVIALAACSARGSGPAGPAWPKPAVREVDGGESLAPRPAARAIAALAEEEKPADKAAPEKPAAATSGGTGSSTADTPGAAAPTATPPDEPINAEDIVIEIED
jgi:hypothetical protein